MNVARAARQLRMTQKTVLHLCRTGGLNACKRNGVWDIAPVFGEHVFTVKALADAMNVSTQLIRRMCIDGTLSEAQKVGGSWRIPMSAAVELMRRRLSIGQAE